VLLIVKLYTQVSVTDSQIIHKQVSVTDNQIIYRDLSVTDNQITHKQVMLLIIKLYTKS
jgi:hypothetical protein